MALGHGTPIDSRDLGEPAPFILEAGISSSRRIAQFWGLTSMAKHALVRAEPRPLALLEIEAALLARGSDESSKGSLIPKAENLIWRALKMVGLIGR
jgi:hypothetical protein